MRMDENIKEIVISKEDAVFWLDKNGCWHNDAGKFRHKKIIDFFNRSIRKDADGFHLCQLRDNCVEKVYFPYEDTALFVFDVIEDAGKSYDEIKALFSKDVADGVEALSKRKSFGTKAESMADSLRRIK